MNIFLLSGYAGVGKSTIAKQLQGVLPECERTAFAKAVKDSVSKIYGIERYVLDTQEGKQTRVHGGGTVRDEIIQYAERRKLHEGDGVWAKEVAAEIRSKSDIRNWILDDWRFPIEYTVLLNAFPEATIHRIRIVNTNVKPYNSAENAMDGQSVDHVWDNTTYDCKDAMSRLVQ
jgi:energy-coupling factor transporter ATP-binding protein EcfA2